MNIRTAVTISAILFATPIVALGFTELEEVDLSVKYQCARIGWENMETLATGAGGVMKHNDAVERLTLLRRGDGSSGVYHFLVPSRCEDYPVGPSSPDMEDFGF